ncbi:MAG: DUF1835 domain-containing protein [Alphaproteobacteria bacterium]
MILHIRCGEDIRDSLVRAGDPGTFQEWSDPVCRGPVPPGLDRADLRALRADWISKAWQLDAEDCLRKQEGQDAALDRLDDYDKVILWFEHDLYDQACLIALLDLIGVRANMFMITIKDHPSAHPRFFGLGQLEPDDLGALFGTETPVTSAQVDQARTAYAAFRAGDETAINVIADLTEGESPLPYLPAAMARHLDELPGTDGLTMTERLTLQALAAGQPTAGRCFAYLMRETEPQPFLGDLMYWGDIRPLFEAPVPAIAPAPAGWADVIALTDFGWALLNGDARWQDENPRDGWWGGRHLGA